MRRETAAGMRSAPVARAIIAAACLAAQILDRGKAGADGVAFAAVFLAYSLVVLLWLRRPRPQIALPLLLADTVFYLGWVSMAAPSAVWLGAALYCYLMLVVALGHRWRDAIVVCAACTAYHLIVAPPGTEALWPSVFVTGVMGMMLAYRRSATESRIRDAEQRQAAAQAEAESARDEERRRIAADLHDGPLQSFISFQVRLEVLRKLLERAPASAAAELEQLQELWRAQIAELRAFLRSMKPMEVEVANLTVSLRRVVETFKKDSGVPAAFTSDNAQVAVSPEAAVEILQILREALNNVQKHSKASRVAVAVARAGKVLSITVSDDGTGFPFSGGFDLEELDQLRLGPGSIKQRVRRLGGELLVDSHPGRGAELKVRVPL